MFVMPGNASAELTVARPRTSRAREMRLPGHPPLSGITLSDEGAKKEPAHSRLIGGSAVGWGL